MANQYFDDWGFLLDKRNTVDEGRGDAIGTMALLYFCTGNQDYITPLFSCLRVDGNLLRHPDLEKNNISRDHLTYWLLAMYKNIEDSIKKNVNPYSLFLLNLYFNFYRRWKISEKANHTIDLWLYENCLLHDFKNKFWNFLYYLVEIPYMFSMMIWNKAIRKIYKLWNFEMLEVTAYEVDFKGEIYNPRAKLLYPAYARHLNAWKIHFMPNSFGKRILQKICLLMDIGNIVIRGLLGDKEMVMKKKEFYKMYGYCSLSGYRWSTELNNTNDRYFLKNEEEIKLDKIVLDYVLNLYK